MKIRMASVVVCLYLAICIGSSDAMAQLKLASLFGDDMVLQRDAKISIWGWSNPGDEVSVQARDQIGKAKANSRGRWMVTLDPMGLGEPFEVLVQGSGEELKLKNVVMGEVWICSGQSNMEWTVSRSANPEQEKLAADYPNIRHIKVLHKTSNLPLESCATTGWQTCSPESVSEFTAVGYYFGRELHQQLNVPVGLINSTWGGTIVEAWTSGESLSTHPDFKDRVAEMQVSPEELKQANEEYQKSVKGYQRALAKQIAKNDFFSEPEFDDSAWSDLSVPGSWESQNMGNFDGTAWYRKQVELPDTWVNKELEISLAKIDDRDRTFVNGMLMGQNTRWDIRRTYKIPAKGNTRKVMTVAVQVLDTGGEGGIYGNANNLKVTNGEEEIAIVGDWRFKQAVALSDFPRPPRNPGMTGPNRPTVLFNAMVNPMIPVSFKGAIWYQGESNAGRAHQYRELFPLLIQDWRKKWKREFPFYWVQLANFMRDKDQPGSSAWAELREAQSMTLKLPKTGEAVIIDIGDARDIHPKNKQDVGRRLAAWALAKDYGRSVPFSGPRFREMKVEGSKVRLYFDFAKGLKSTDDQPLARFEIAGKDQKFVWAEAKIEGDEVVVMADSVTNPVAVRYAWADNPVGANLTNESNIPASPFRTDQWQGVTVGKR